MSIKSTLNLKQSQADVVYTVAKRFEMSISSVLNALARKIFISHAYDGKVFETVKYQKKAALWKKVPISFDVDAYEKCQDLRKMFKISVSRAFAEAIEKYLNELILELEGKKESDNYNRNYFAFYKWRSNFAHVTLLWDMVDTEILEKIYELQRET